jgi:hypothetical protein
MLRVIFSLVITIAFFNSSLAQNECNNWFFGCGYGVTFNSGNPVSIVNKGNCGRYGNSTISNANGRLLFYTGYSTIMDTTQKVMPNGTLKFDCRTIQPSLIVPWPDSSHLFFLFTPGGQPYESFKYSIINMKLRGGLGDVVTGKKELELPTLASGKVTAIKHANRSEYWVLTPQGNSDTIAAYLITSKGIITTPIKSATGIFVKAGSALYGDDYCGQFKISPNGKKLCNINSGKTSMIADFDASTGQVHNIWNISLEGPALEFSPKSHYLFAFSQQGVISQYDLSVKSKSAFLNSRTTIDSNLNYYTPAMQLAPDGKIYVYTYNSQYLNVIHAPDSAKKVRFQKNFFKYTPYVENISHWGLPSYVQSFLKQPSFDFRHNCAKDTVFFNITETYDLDSAHWDFDDPLSGKFNFSKNIANVFHVYKNSGTYKVRLISYFKNYQDTIYETFFLNFGKPYLGADTTICNYETILLQNLHGKFKTYHWNTGQKSPGLFVQKPGKYSLKVTDEDGCSSSDTIEIKNASITSNFTISDSALCLINNKFIFTETSKYTSTEHLKSTWYFEDSSIIIDSFVVKSFMSPGTHSIKLVTVSQNNCIDSITKVINIWPNPVSSFKINDEEQCFRNHSFNFINESTILSGNLRFEWNLADLNSFQADFNNKTYLKPGNYKISLVSISDNLCRDTVSKSIEIFANPQADFSWIPTCEFSPMQFLFTGTKPSLPAVTSILWDFEGERVADIDNPTKTFKGIGKKKVGLFLTSDNGCNDSISKEIEVLPKAKAEFNANDICEGDSVNFVNQSSGGINFKWKFGDGMYSTSNSPKYKYQIGGITQTYNVTLVAIIPDGCSDSIIKAVTVNSSPKSDFTYLLSGRLVNFKALETNASQYNWDFGDGNSLTTINSQTSYNYTQFPSGKYNACLKVTNVANCKSETCNQINITGAVKQQDLESGIQIYPNPNNGSFIVSSPESSNIKSIELLNQVGQVVYKSELHQKHQSFDLNLPSGIYQLKVISGNNIQIQRIVVSH